MGLEDSSSIHPFYSVIPSCVWASSYHDRLTLGRKSNVVEARYRTIDTRSKNKLRPNSNLEFYHEVLSFGLADALFWTYQRDRSELTKKFRELLNKDGAAHKTFKLIEIELGLIYHDHLTLGRKSNVVEAHYRTIYTRSKNKLHPNSNLDFYLEVLSFGLVNALSWTYQVWRERVGNQVNIQEKVCGSCSN
ncbi:hypothetical protein HYC85_009218 [Camellia sinensis]|uniref:Uncharacterized protein n=1 Tax=Camellia sinensis TaxID=4442 RepID=A0A7J7HH22_CAMSI|nr:hypothetical protein HYC85_009218 [Camellia sinensis]